ncbi:MAG: alanine--tRNA ligase [Nanobdellota archaeon]
MRTAKELKKELKKDASKDPDKYYATGILKKDGFVRKECTNCGQWFWTVNKDQDLCGDPVCSGGFRFFENNPAEVSLDYVSVWKKFSKMFKDLGYTPISRYPVVARWNETMEYTNASIAAFQPFVINGEVEPPANPLVIPQFCIRFGDIENIGITAGHNTGFVMIGQHMFIPKQEWDQEKVFSDIKKWLNTGLGIPDEELTFHEDGWAGGGNAGPCMEYFCRGVELGNQVYMMYEQTPEDTLVDLDLKVLDMGMGMERVAWFTQATATQHQAIYPTVINKLCEKTGVEIDDEFLKKYVPHSGKLNIDEVDDIQKAWQEVADILEMDVPELKEKVMPIAGIFSIADHTRVLLFTLNDGALPSNVGGGYNLRILIRRALSFIDKFGWDIKLSEVCRWHAEYLNEIYPELIENLDNIEKILQVERDKYEATKEKTRRIVENIIHKDITEETLLELYDSNGITPELVKEEAKKHVKEIHVPENFFGKVSELHEKKEQAHASKKDFSLDLTDVPNTIANYYNDYTRTEFDAQVLKIIDNKVILDRTLFYPTSGGQMHDTGNLGGLKIEDVFKQGSIIVHVLEVTPQFNEGETIRGHVDFERRKQLAQHHTATHVVNLAARRILGNHVNQAGAKKTCEKAHLDITHYKTVSDEELKQIEEQANKIVKQDLKITTGFYPRREAEDKFGMGIYQGGAVPGRQIRIVEIDGIDAEACGGTHLHKTSEVGQVKLEKSTKIQDGTIRLTFTAGKAADESCAQKEDILRESAELLGVKECQVPARAQELFKLWKKAKKAKKKDKEIPQIDFCSNEEFQGDALEETAKILKTQKPYVLNTLKKFIKEIENINKQ